MYTLSTAGCEVEQKKELPAVVDGCRSACSEINNWLDRLAEARERLMGTPPAKVLQDKPDNAAESGQLPITAQLHRLHDQLVKLSDRLHCEVDYISSVI